MHLPSASARLLAPLGVCAVALFISLVFTSGMSPSFDSARYANVAHWIAAGEGISTSLTVVPVQEGAAVTSSGLRPFTLQPPGLPLFYALTGVENRAVAHRSLHVVSYVLLAWLVLALGRKLSGRLVVGVTAALLTVLSPVMLLTAANFWNDLTTVTLMYGALYLVVCAGEKNRRAWAWLLAASVVAALTISFRLTGLAFGAVLLADLVLNRRRPMRTQLVRLVAGAGVFGGVLLGILLRNRMYTGSVTGIAPHDWPLAPAFSLSRGWSYFGSRLLQAMTPAWAVDSVAAKLTAANAGTAVWLLPSLLTVVVVGLAGVLLVLRRSGRISWPPASVGLVPGSRILAGALFGASVLVLLVPCGRHAEIRAIEFRYLAPLLPLLWVAVATVLLSSGRRLVDWGLAAILVAVFAVGVPGQHRPYRHSHEFMRAGLDWLKMTVPSETVILSNGGKVLLDEDLTRRVFHISDWNFRHALGRELREEAGFLRYLRRNGIRYVVLFGAADRRKAEYWGRPLIGLFLGRWWQPWLAYRDDHVQVYRIPPTGPPPAHTRGTGP